MIRWEENKLQLFGFAYSGQEKLNMSLFLRCEDLKTVFLFALMPLQESKLHLSPLFSDSFFPLF